MQLNPRQLEAFRLVMMRGSVTSAAQDLNISQPAVSRLIRDLEVRTGIALFERRSNHVVPTPEAYLMLAEVERYAGGLTAIASFAEALRTHKRGTLSIFAMPAIAMGFLPRFVADFIDGRDLSGVHLHGMPSHLVIDAVMNGQVEIGISASPPERPGLKITPIKSYAVLAVPADHRLAGKKRVRISDLANERLITLSDPLMIDFSSTAQIATIATGKSITTPLSGIACALVGQGVGVAIVDPFAASDYLDRGVKVLQLHPSIDIHVALITNEHRRLSAISREFIDAFRKYAEALYQ